MARNMNCYAGIGSRETPPDVLKLMEEVALVLTTHGWTMRSGGQPKGADGAFLKGVPDPTKREIYFPWPGFVAGLPCTLDGPTAAAIELASHHHPNWPAVKQGGQKLHGRNSHIILGPMLDDPVAFVLCWTPGGGGGGGTGLGMSLAVANSIIVYDMAIAKNRAMVEAWIQEGGV